MEQPQAKYYISQDIRKYSIKKNPKLKKNQARP
jgi:hypothetical protein